MSSSQNSALQLRAELVFADQMFEPMPSGALFWPDRNSLLVADLHLEKMASFAGRGKLLPPYDTGLTLRRLEQDLKTTGAGQVIAMGDSFHRDEGTASLQTEDKATLERLVASVEWIWLAGNHDPAPHTLGGTCAAFLSIDGIKISHEPEADGGSLIAGHLHPSARIAINGRSQRSACFVADQRLLILPAYGNSTGTLNILGSAFQGLLRYGSLQVTMLGRDRVYPVSEKRLVHG